MKPIRTYAVKVEGFPPVLYSARSQGKARSRAWRDYRAAYDRTSFAEFIKISRVSRAPDPPGCGERIIVSGQTVTRVYDPRNSSNGVFYMKDDSDVVLCSHPSDVAGGAV